MKRFFVIFAGVTLVVFTFTGLASAGHGQININTATAEEIQLLPGIGDATANNIVEFRQANGPFTSLDDLVRVKGIGEAKLRNIRNFIKLEGMSDYRPTETAQDKGHAPKVKTD